MKPLLSLVLSFSMIAGSQLTAQDAPAITESKPVKLACVGDSITGGFGVTKGMSCMDQISKMLGGKCEVGNFGLGARIFAPIRAPNIT